MGQQSIRKLLGLEKNKIRETVTLQALNQGLRESVEVAAVDG
jgi:hypothetical protein